MVEGRKEGERKYAAGHVVIRSPPFSLASDEWGGRMQTEILKMNSRMKLKIAQYKMKYKTKMEYEPFLNKEHLFKNEAVLRMGLC